MLVLADQNGNQCWYREIRCGRVYARPRSGGSNAGTSVPVARNAGKRLRFAVRATTGCARKEGPVPYVVVRSVPGVLLRCSRVSNKQRG